MSIDVFGRNLKRGGESNRGPPGIGYKFTLDSQYDIENKRLCNVANPKNSHDAVNLKTVHATQEEMQKMMNVVSLQFSNDLKSINDVTSQHKSDIEMISILCDEFKKSRESISTNVEKINEKLNRLDRDIENIKYIMAEISENIHSKDTDV